MRAPTEFTVYAKQMSFTRPLERGNVLRVGRGTGMDVRIDDPSVSRLHVLVHVTGSGVHVEDQGSSNGTFLQRGTESVTPTRLIQGEPYPLVEGDVLRVGGVPLLFQASNRRSSSHVDKNTLPPPSGSGGRVLVDPEMKRVYELASRAAQSEISVLITGETGAGKEHLASAVHEGSPRANKPFMQINCAALSETILESELFGHEKGAFTGAIARRAGLLEAAAGGTVFLDEIGEMPLSTQAKLLRVLEERQIRRLGASRNQSINVRFVAATNRNLQAEIAAGRFRGDLFFRISGMTLRVPPLRERPGEIEPLARRFIKDFCLQSGIAAPELTPEGLDALRSYPWPGNVRELKNAMQRAPFLSGGAPLRPEHLPSIAGLMPLDHDDFLEEENTDVRAMPVDFGISSIYKRRISDAAPINRLLDPLVSGGVPLSGAGALEPYDRRSSSPTSPLRPPSDGMAHLTHGNSRVFSEEEEKQRVIQALEECCGNQTRAAQMLGVSRRTLINRIETFGLPRPRKTP